MFSFISVDPMQYESLEDLERDIVEFEDYSIPMNDVQEIVKKETKDLDADGEPIVILELVTIDGRFKFYETGIKEFCKAIKYSFSNFSVLDEENIIDDLNYRINDLRYKDLNITFRTEKFTNAISHCYPYKSDKPAGAPLFNKEILQLIKENPDIFDPDKLVSILLDENNLCVTYRFKHNAIGFDGVKEVFTRGISIHNNEVVGKGGLRIGCAFITNEGGHVFFDRNEATLRRSIDLPHESTLEAAKAHIAALNQHTAEELDLTAPYVRMHKELKPTTQNIGYLYRDMKGVSKKDKQNIFQQFLVHIQDEPTDEILPTSILEDRALTLWHIFIDTAQYSNAILAKDTLKVSNFINAALFAGDLLDEHHLIYGNYL